MEMFVLFSCELLANTLQAGKQGANSRSFSGHGIILCFVRAAKHRAPARRAAGRD